MNITEEKTGDLTATIKLEVKEEDYAEKYQQELKQHRKQANVPGFRPGKVPLGYIEKKFGLAVKVEEVNKLISQKITDYIQDNKLKLLGNPIPNAEKDPQDFMRQKDFNFYFDIAYAPELDLNFEDFAAVEYIDIKVDDERLDEQIAEIRKRNGKMVEQDEVSKDDMIYVNIHELDDDGKIKEGGISKETMILVNYLKKEDVQEQVIGSKVGDVVIFNPLEATGSETETASMLGIEKEAAKELTSDFQFEITKIERSTPAELDEELFKAAFPKDDIKTEEEFREKVREEVAKAYKVESDRLFSRKAMDRLFDDSEINLPDEFLKKWLYQSNEGKLSMEAIEENYDGYRKAMKMELIENALIKKNESLRVTDEDLKGEIKNYFKGYFLPGQPQDENEDPAMAEQLEQIANNYLEKNKDETRRIHDELFSRRIAGYLKEEMTLDTKEVSYKEFEDEIKKITGHDHDHDHDHADDHDHSHDEDNESADKA